MREECVHAELLKWRWGNKGGRGEGAEGEMLGIGGGSRGVGVCRELEISWGCSLNWRFGRLSVDVLDQIRNI